MCHNVRRSITFLKQPAHPIHLLGYWRTLSYSMWPLLRHGHTKAGLLANRLYIQYQTSKWFVQVSFFGRSLLLNVLPGCKKMNCTRLMSPPARNPIRISPTVCAECTERRRVGVLGLGQTWYTLYLIRPEAWTLNMLWCRLTYNYRRPIHLRVWVKLLHDTHRVHNYTISPSSMVRWKKRFFPSPHDAWY